MTDSSGVGSPAGEPTPEPFFDDGAPDPFGPPPAAPNWPPPAPPAGWQPPAGWSPYPPPRYPRPRSTNGFAIASLVCSIVGFFLYGIPAVVGLVLGIVALRRIRVDGQGGQGLAIAGITVGAVVIVMWIAVFSLVAVARP